MAAYVDTVRSAEFAPAWHWHYSTAKRIDSQAFRSQKQRAEAIDIIDIRQHGIPLDLTYDIRSGLQSSHDDKPRSLPSLLLWDERGLKHFEEVTYSPQYYLTNTEIVILERHSYEMARNIKANSILLELGSGNLRKINILLKALEAQRKSVDYFALDLERKELERTLRELRPGKFVRCHGLLGTYDDGKAWAASHIRTEKPKYVLSLGSTMGSFTRTEAAHFWGGWAKALQPKNSHASDANTNSRIIIGLDGCKEQDKVFHAYNDRDGANKRFILNTLDHANAQLGYKAFDRRDWAVRGEWDPTNGRHEQYLVPLKDVYFEGVCLPRQERIHVVNSHKYDEGEKDLLWSSSQLREMETYMNDEGSYGLHVLSS